MSSRSRVVAIVQARMGATRLFGKPLKEVLGRPLLDFQIERIKRSQSLDQIVIATTDKKQDDPIAHLAKQLGVELYRGSEEDVLDRYFKAAQNYSADIVVRITGDCPLIDPAIIDQMVKEFQNKQPLDYLSNALQRTFPRGMDVEIFSFQALEKEAKEASKPEEREHVTPYLYRHPERFKLENFLSKEDNSKYRLTVDTNEDFELISKLIEILYPKNPQFSLDDILKVLKKNPELSAINAHVEQKKI